MWRCSRDRNSGVSLVELNPCRCYAEGRWPFLVCSGRRRIVAATPKTGSDAADVASHPVSRAAAFRSGKRCSLFQNPKTGACNPWARGSSGPWKGTNFQARITVFERYCHGRIKGEQILRQIWWFLGGKSVVTVIKTKKEIEDRILKDLIVNPALGNGYIFRGLSGKRSVQHAELGTCSCGPWTNLVTCNWPSSDVLPHTPALKRHSWLTLASACELIGNVT